MSTEEPPDQIFGRSVGFGALFSEVPDLRRAVRPAVSTHDGAPGLPDIMRFGEHTVTAFEGALVLGPSVAPDANDTLVDLDGHVHWVFGNK